MFTWNVGNFMTTSLLSQLLASINNSQTVALATVVKTQGEFAAALGRKALFDKERLLGGELDLGELTTAIHAEICRAVTQGRTQLLTFADDALSIFVEVQQPPPTLIIVGAGHVAQPLAQLGKLINFDVVVLDDRPQFANRQRFPQADRILAEPMAATLRDWPISDNTHIVLVTRGHSHDVECLQEIIDSPARYIGMIGSKRRIKGVFDLLEQEKGISRHKLDRVYAPIGLDIGAETPAEIAICIISEIINLYRGGRVPSLADALRVDSRLPLHPRKKSEKAQTPSVTLP